MRIFSSVIFIVLASWGTIAPLSGASNASPAIPVGYDAYLQWEKWPQQRPGMRAYMRSTYDRAGGNESVDGSHFLYMKEENFNVTLDVVGRGCLYFFRTNHWHGSPWHFVVDGTDNLVSESATADPVWAKKRIKNATFIPAEPFPQPLAWTWGATRGSDLIWTPMEFADSLKLAYSRTRYGTGYYIYHLFADDTPLTRPLETWSLKTVPPQEVLDLVAAAGTDIAPKDISKIEGQVTLDRDRVVIAEIGQAPSDIRALKFTLPLEMAESLERVRLVITWDGAAEASVDAPLCLFFGAGTFYNRDSREGFVKAFPVNVRFDYDRKVVELACYFPMPFFKSARIELAGIPSDTLPAGTTLRFEVRHTPHQGQPSESSYFHATYRDFPEPETGRDMVLLDTKDVEGVSDWSGNFVGTSFIFSHDGVLDTLEGDPRFFFDDARSPQAYGTGTEEWGGGGDYWGGLNMTLPLAGHPCGAKSKTDAKAPKDLIQSAYRFLLADLMPFGKRAVITLEHGAENISTEHYETVTYWYGLPAATLVQTDAFDVGDEIDERAHAYHSPDASPVERVQARYELGIDTFPSNPWGLWGKDPTTVLPWYMDRIGQEVYPAHEETGRHTAGTSEFTVKLDPQNRGALLRRTLDYQFPNQTAEVYISDVGSDKWEHVGVWYLAGANTCMHSDPLGEIDRRQLKTKTSNRRFRDDEFLLPARVTAGRTAVRVRVVARPGEQELFPGFSFPHPSEWSELRYDVYCFVTPKFARK